MYYFMKSVHGRDTHIRSNVVENPHCELHAHTSGPMYWRLLSTWQESLPSSKVTQIATPVSPERLPELDHSDPSDTTQPTRAIRRSTPPPDSNEVTRIGRRLPKELPPALSIDDTHPRMPPLC